MTLAQSASASSAGLDIPMADAPTQPRIAIESQLGELASQATHQALQLWIRYQPVTLDKTQAVWQLLRNTQPVQLLLTAAIALLTMALVTLVSTFSGLIIVLLKLAALVLATVAVGQWIVRGLTWADEKLPPVDDVSQ